MQSVAQKAEIDKRINEARARAELEASIKPSLIAALARVPAILRHTDDALVILSTSADAPEAPNAPSVLEMLTSPPVIKPKIKPMHVELFGDGIRIWIMDRSHYDAHYDAVYARGAFPRTMGMDWDDWLSHKPGTVCCLLASHFHFFGGCRVRLETDG